MRALNRLAPSAPLATALIAATAILFGLTPLFARALQTAGLDDASIALSRYLFTMLVIWPWTPLARAKRGEALRAAAAGMAMGLGWIAYLGAIERAPVAAAGVVYMSYPLFAVLFAWAFAGQRPGPRALGAASLVLLAALLLNDSGRLSAEAMRALLWSLPAPAGFGLIVVVLSCLTPSLSPLERMASGMGGACLGLAPLAFTAEGATAALSSGGTGIWALLIALGVVTALAPQFLYTVSAPRVGPARAASAGALELPTMIAVGALAFGEAVGPREAVAALLVMGAVFVSPSIAPARPAPA